MTDINSIWIVKKRNETQKKNTRNVYIENNLHDYYSFSGSIIIRIRLYFYTEQYNNLWCDSKGNKKKYIYRRKNNCKQKVKIKKKTLKIKKV